MPDTSHDALLKKMAQIQNSKIIVSDYSLCPDNRRNRGALRIDLKEKYCCVKQTKRTETAAIREKDAAQLTAQVQRGHLPQQTRTHF